jgi:hypothetical protein
VNLSELKEWILVASGSIALISASISSWLALREYRVKLQAETRAANSEKAESDVRLLKAFTELNDVANGRGGYEVSEKLIDELFKSEIFTKAEFADLESLKKRIGEFPVVYLPVGGAAQDAAIAAIATLGLRHEVLREAALQALESAKGFRKEIAEKHIQRMSKS